MTANNVLEFRKKEPEEQLPENHLQDTLSKLATDFFVSLAYHGYEFSTFQDYVLFLEAARSGIKRTMNDYHPLQDVADELKILYTDPDDHS